MNVLNQIAKTSVNEETIMNHWWTLGDMSRELEDIAYRVSEIPIPECEKNVDIKFQSRNRESAALRNLAMLANCMRKEFDFLAKEKGII